VSSRNAWVTADSLTDAERRRLARKARCWGGRFFVKIETLVTPEHLMRWYRELVASIGTTAIAWPGPSARDEGYRRSDPAHGEDNPSWGTRESRERWPSGTRGRTGTIANILKEHGLSLTRARQTHSWSSFLKAHWDCLSQQTS